MQFLDNEYNKYISMEIKWVKYAWNILWILEILHEAVPNHVIQVVVISSNERDYNMLNVIVTVLTAHTSLLS